MIDFSADDDADHSDDDIAERHVDTEMGGGASGSASAGGKIPLIDPSALLEMTSRLAPSILDPTSKGMAMSCQDPFLVTLSMMVPLQSSGGEQQQWALTKRRLEPRRLPTVHLQVEAVETIMDPRWARQVETASWMDPD